VALAHLVRECLARGGELIDCQMVPDHLASLGSRSLPRLEFEKLLAPLCAGPDDLWRR
jgi:Leu/Phe-tRNA-protein transferase